MTSLNSHSYLMGKCSGSIQASSSRYIFFFLVKYKYLQTYNPPKTSLIFISLFPFPSGFEIFELAKARVYLVTRAYTVVS